MLSRNKDNNGQLIKVFWRVCEFMRFISMQLYNFKNFHGLSNPIEFGRSEESNITVIAGNGGSGKTNIRKAMIWLLYGDSFEPYNDKSPIINICSLDEAKIGEELNYWVDLSFNYHGKVYKVKRTQRMIKMGNAKYKNEYNSIIELYLQDDNQNWKQVKDPQLTIDKIFPLELYRYLIGDSEKLEELLRNENRKQLLNTIVKIIGTNEYDLSDMTRFISNKINNSISALGKGDLFQFNIANKSGDKWTDELSMGIKKLIGLSIISAVIECLKSSNTSSTDLEYPLIIDSLFNILDEDKAFRFFSILSESASQVIIMINNTQLEKLSKGELAKKAVSYYQLDNYDKGSRVRIMPV